MKEEAAATNREIRLIRLRGLCCDRDQVTTRTDEDGSVAKVLRFQVEASQRLSEGKRLVFALHWMVDRKQSTLATTEPEETHQLPSLHLD